MADEDVGVGVAATSQLPVSAPTIENGLANSAKESSPPLSQPGLGDVESSVPAGGDLDLGQSPGQPHLLDASTGAAMRPRRPASWLLLVKAGVVALVLGFAGGTVSRTAFPGSATLTPCS